MGKYLTQIETSFILNSIDPSEANVIMDVGAEAGRFSLILQKQQRRNYQLRHRLMRPQTIKTQSKKHKRYPSRRPKNPSERRNLRRHLHDRSPRLHSRIGQALAECHRTLRPNASLILSFGNRTSLKAKLRELSGKSYQHSYRNVIKALVETGFSVKKKTGYNWLLFGRMSENRMIPILARMERFFGLRRIPSLSPWVILHATKSHQHSSPSNDLSCLCIDSVLCGVFREPSPWNWPNLFGNGIN